VTRIQAHDEENQQRVDTHDWIVEGIGNDMRCKCNSCGLTLPLNSLTKSPPGKLVLEGGLGWYGMCYCSTQTVPSCASVRMRLALG